MINVEQNLSSYAKGYEAEMGWTGDRLPADWEIHRNNTIRNVLIELDMTYRAFAESSWTTEVLTLIGNHEQELITPPLHPEVVFKMYEMEAIIVKAINYGIDCAYTKYRKEYQL